MVLATLKLQLLGAVVALDGAHVSHEVTFELAKWPTCKNSTDVRGLWELSHIRLQILQKSPNLLKRLASAAVPAKLYFSEDVKICESPVLYGIALLRNVAGLLIELSVTISQ